MDIKDIEFDFGAFFKKYENIVATTDIVFEKVKNQHPDCVICKIGCSDCCNALFDLSLIEAMYINYKFNSQFNLDKKLKENLIEKANRADRAIYRLKREAFKKLVSGSESNEILLDIANHRVRCPMLNEQERCEIYDYRPITCRVYGIPTLIGNKGHTCGKSLFNTGEKYKTVNLDVIHEKLYEISKDLLISVKSKYLEMANIFVPLSTAIISIYDKAFFDGERKNE